MKKIKIINIAKDLNVTHGAVSHWFSGKNKPNYENMVILKDKYKIPFEAWKDIKSFINANTTKTEVNYENSYKRNFKRVPTNKR